MFVVYWIDSLIDAPCCKKFGVSEMKEALSCMEELRKDQHVEFVTMCSENPNSVGKPGVDEVGPDYNWTKRRETMKR